MQNTTFVMLYLFVPFLKQFVNNFYRQSGQTHLKPLPFSMNLYQDQIPWCFPFFVQRRGCMWYEAWRLTKYDLTVVMRTLRWGVVFVFFYMKTSAKTIPKIIFGFFDLPFWNCVWRKKAFRRTHPMHAEQYISRKRNFWICCTAMMHCRERI